jgi:FKBP-type peptidyl-prolyl cis-trans isomerase FklB
LTRGRGIDSVRPSARCRAALVGVAIAVVSSRAGAEPPADTARESYSLGHQIGVDLIRQGAKADPDAVAEGARDGLAGRAPAYPQDELDALLLALKRRIVAADGAERLGGAPTLRRAGEAFLADNALREDVIVRPSGLQYRVLRPGAGARPGPTDEVEVRYRSTRLDGTPFHDSTGPDRPPDVHRLGSLIPGLREALPLMAVGARWEIFLPPDLAFGRRGPLADQVVIYDLELLAVRSEDASTSGAAP